MDKKGDAVTRVALVMAIEAFLDRWLDSTDTEIVMANSLEQEVFTMKIHRPGLGMTLQNNAYTGYYHKGDMVYRAYNQFSIDDGVQICRLQSFADYCAPYPDIFRTHEEWVRLGYKPVCMVE